MTKTFLTIALIVAIVLLVAVAVFAVFLYKECCSLGKEYQKKDDEYRVLHNYYKKLEAEKSHKRDLAAAPEPEYSNPQASPVQTWDKEDVKYKEPAKKGAQKVVKSKVYFPLSEDGLFFKKHNTCESSCVYEAQEVAPRRYEFTIISAAKAKAWSIADAVTIVGRVLQKDAVGFKCIKKGEVVEREDDSHQPYWEITQKTEIEFTK